jgi:lysozyme
LLKSNKSLDDIKAGNFTSAIKKCNKIWASLPGSPYNQHPKDIAVATAYYKQGGGTVVA